MKTKLETYYRTTSEAIDASFAFAEAKGFEVGPPTLVSYNPYMEKTSRYRYSLTKGGKPVNNELIVSLYKMPSSNLELVTYIS